MYLPSGLFDTFLIRFLLQAFLVELCMNSPLESIKEFWVI